MYGWVAPASGGAPPESVAGVGIGTFFNLSLIKTPKPATGILETLVSFVFVSGGAGLGSYPETSTGGVEGGFVILLFFPNGLNCEIKFVPGLSSPGVFVVCPLKYKNPKTPITAIAKIIIKSMKFLFDIN